jgi:lipopolysaccharide export system protein LptC
MKSSDDANTMTRAGETVGKAVGSGWVAFRRGAKRASKAGAEATVRAAHAADKRLTERGVAPSQVTEALLEGAEVARQELAKASRRTRRKLAKTTQHTKKELAKAAKQAKKEAKKSKAGKQVSKSAKQAKKDAKEMKAAIKAEIATLKARAKEVDGGGKKRRWPKVVLLVIVASGVAYVVRGKAAAQQEPTPVPEPRRQAEKPESTDSAKPGPKGQHNGQQTKDESASKR